MATGMAISASDVKRLRDETGVGMMDCKRALTEANGDFEAAIEILRKKGQKVAAKRADREAKEGVIATAASADGSTSVLVEVNSETDFVARNAEFQQFAQAVADLALAKRVADRDALLALDFDGGTVAAAVEAMTGRIGEKIDVRRVALVESDGGKAVSYIHPGSRLGVIVDVASTGLSGGASGNGNSESVGRDVAMQVAALNPIALSRDEVPTEVKEKEMEIAREFARSQGKPEQIIDKIATGTLERYYKDNVLTEQPFVKDASTRVGDLLNAAGVKVRRYVRFALGD